MNINILTVFQKEKKESNSTDNFQCSECEFVSKSRNGVKTHKTRMHTKTDKLKYPIDCELCDASLENEKDMKEHLKYHKYKKATFKCEDCDYWCENFLTMEVHVGKFHSETLECGMCSWEAKDIESLNLHIATCEIYTCEDCNYRTKHLHDIKEHLNNKHDKQTYHEIIHAKINRKDPEVIDHDIHIKYQICS